jgi:hypothetical protein
VAFIFTPLVVVLVVAAFVTAFVVRPPALGWVGFAIVSAVVAGLGAVATVALPRMRVSAPTPATPADADRRLLVVADASCSAAGLCNEIRARLDGAVAVHLVVPVRVSHLHFLTNDEAEEQREAEQTMLTVGKLLRQHGIVATGSVGSDKPLESMTDALGAFPATHVLLATPPAEESYWLERDLLAKAQALTVVPITQATVVAADQPRRPTGQQPAPAGAGDPSRPSGARQLCDARPAEIEPIVANLGLGKGPLLDAHTWSEQVDDLDLSCREQIGDQSSVAAPRERLGAHEAWILSAERVREGLLPFARGHPRRIASERGNAEARESVLSGNARTTAAEIWCVHVRDRSRLQLDGQRRLAELRVAP